MHCEINGITAGKKLNRSVICRTKLKLLRCYESYYLYIVQIIIYI